MTSINQVKQLLDAFEALEGSPLQGEIIPLVVDVFTAYIRKHDLSGLVPAEIKLVKEHRLQAIRRVQDRTACDLKMATQLVEWERNRGSETSSEMGFKD